MFIVVLDTNSLYGDFRLESRQALKLRDNLRELGGELVIPEVVVDEAERKFDELLRENLGELKKSIKRYRQLTGSDDINIPNKPEDIKNSSLRQRLLEVADRLICYPILDHQQVVKRLLAGYRPFSGTEDKGYRDFLIWLSVLQVATESHKTVLFVTSNSNDFCTKKGNQLHEDLIKDLEARRIPSNRLVITRSFSSANEDFLEKELKFSPAILSETERKDFLNHAQILLESDLLGEVTDLVSSGRWVRVIVTEFNEPPKISIERIISTGADTRQVTARFDGNALVDIVVPITEIKPALECLELADLHVIEPDYDEDESNALIYGYTKVSGILIARLPRGSSSIEGATVEEVKIGGIKVPPFS
ncbi:MAG TPA: PIN domain-containing protein [Coleofasciculaceae cyanobacterium]|jgi:hypothetical protein